MQRPSAGVKIPGEALEFTRRHGLAAGVAFIEGFNGVRFSMEEKREVAQQLSQNIYAAQYSSRRRFR